MWTNNATNSNILNTLGNKNITNEPAKPKSDSWNRIIDELFVWDFAIAGKSHIWV